MKLAQLKEATAKLKDSSIYRYGDALAFKVPFLHLECELPGPRCPKEWIERLENKFGFQIAKGSSVMVAGAGNGGLCAEAIHQGATGVLAVEQRVRYHDALNEVIRLLGELHGIDGKTFLKWPSGKALAQLGKWDLILFPEGLAECTHPGSVMVDLISLLAPGGSMIVEVTHGTQDYRPDPVNSFRPTPRAWKKMVEEICGQAIVQETPGSATGRVIYRLQLKGAVGKPTPKKPAPPPPFPKEIPAAKVKPFTPPPPPPAPAKLPNGLRERAEEEEVPVVIVDDDTKLDEPETVKKKTRTTRTKKKVTKKSPDAS
jgi:hypothetical protein